MSRVAALLVTHDAERWIEPLLASIAAQTRPPDSVVVVDDHSRDATADLLRDALGERLVLLEASTSTTDRKTRIARNFEQGLRACADHDVVVIGDHDDIWHPTRVAHQAGVLEDHPDLLMVASDGRLVDEAGASLSGTLRDTFPVPDDFARVDGAQRMRAALRSPIATGGASAVRPGFLAASDIPAGWLHDRWWSLLATARESIQVDDDVVIDYRVTSGQQVGLDPGLQGLPGARRLTAGVRNVGVLRQRVADISQGLAPKATAITAPELSGWRLLRNLL